MDFIRTHSIKLLILACGALLCLGIYVLIQNMHERPQIPRIMRYDDTTDADKVQKVLQVTPKESKEIVREIQYIHDGNKAPNATYYVQAPNIEKAAEQTSTAIERKDPSLPKAATDKSDRTIVTANTDKQKVDVYKINLRNNHKIKAGLLFVDSKIYPGTGYQAGRYEGMIYANGSKIKAGTVTYTIREW